MNSRQLFRSAQSDRALQLAPEYDARRNVSRKKYSVDSPPFLADRPEMDSEADQSGIPGQTCEGNLHLLGGATGEMMSSMPTLETCSHALE